MKSHFIEGASYVLGAVLSFLLPMACPAQTADHPRVAPLRPAPPNPLNGMGLVEQQDTFHRKKRWC